MKPNIVVEIDELVLVGFPPGDHYRIGDTLIQELQRLFSDAGAPAALNPSGTFSTDIMAERIAAPTIQLASGGRAESLGIQIARAVYGGLDR